MRRTSSIRATYTTARKLSFALMGGARDHLLVSRITNARRPLLDTLPARSPAHLLARGLAMPPATTAPSVLIRAARGSDGAALTRLAALDSAPVPAGDLLVGEADGELVAARSLATGAVIADPFRPTADVVALLGLRAGALADGERRRPRRVRSLLRPARVASRIA
jgi:hypothetical protein